MNFDELNAEMGRSRYTIPKLAKEVGISNQAMYERFKGETQFKQGEIVIIKRLLNLSDKRIIEIFFDEKVS
ncbi:MAG: hypothetical protein U0O22_04030 [Acutalibacteraceae bacterium]